MRRTEKKKKNSENWEKREEEVRRRRRIVCVQNLPKSMIIHPMIIIQLVEDFFERKKMKKSHLRELNCTWIHFLHCWKGSKNCSWKVLKLFLKDSRLLSNIASHIHTLKKLQFSLNLNSSLNKLYFERISTIHNHSLTLLKPIIFSIIFSLLIICVSKLSLL